MGNDPILKTKFVKAVYLNPGINAYVRTSESHRQRWVSQLASAKHEFVFTVGDYVCIAVNRFLPEAYRTVPGSSPKRKLTGVTFIETPEFGSLFPSHETEYCCYAASRSQVLRFLERESEVIKHKKITRVVAIQQFVDEFRKWEGTVDLRKRFHYIRESLSQQAHPGGQSCLDWFPLGRVLRAFFRPLCEKSLLEARARAECNTNKGNPPASTY